MILDEWVDVGWNGANKKHYENLGYVYEHNKKFKVPPECLPNSSSLAIRFKCDSCGYEYTSNWESYVKKKNKTWCINCYPAATKTIEFVKAEFEKRGYTLLTNHYVNAHKPLEYICNKHPDTIQNIVYNSLQQGCGCYYCGLEKRSEKQRLTYARIEEVATQHDITLVCSRAENERSNVIFICNRHPDLGMQFVNYNDLQQGSTGCPYCRKERTSGRNSFLYKGKTLYPSQYVRSYLTEWKKEVAAKSGYVCEVSGEKSNSKFVVHHLSSSHVLLERLLLGEGIQAMKGEKIEYSSEILARVVTKYVEEHKHIEGAFISKEVHKLFHKIYGVRNNTPEQFYKFKSDFQAGIISLTGGECASSENS
jgi:hypothetical protein